MLPLTPDSYYSQNLSWPEHSKKEKWYEYNNKRFHKRLPIIHRVAVIKILRRSSDYIILYHVTSCWRLIHTWCRTASRLCSHRRGTTGKTSVKMGQRRSDLQGRLTHKSAFSLAEGHLRSVSDCLLYKLGGPMAANRPQGLPTSWANNYKRSS